jgi:hypothetical protein
MKAMVQERFGLPDVLRLVDTDLPEVGADDVLVRVHTAGPVRLWLWRGRVPSRPPPAGAEPYSHAPARRPHARRSRAASPDTGRAPAALQRDRHEAPATRGDFSARRQRAFASSALSADWQ